MQILDPEFEVRLVVLPRHTIHTGSGFALKRVERRPERIDTDMVEERGELLLLPLPCGLPYTAQRLGAREPGSAPGACFADPRSPWSPALVPPAPPPVARLCSSASSLLCRSQTSLNRASTATAPHLPATDHPTQQGLRPIQRSPGSRTRSVRTCQGLRPRRVRQALAVARLPILPSVK